MFQWLTLKRCKVRSFDPFVFAEWHFCILFVVRGWICIIILAHRHLTTPGHFCPNLSKTRRLYKNDEEDTRLSQAQMLIVQPGMSWWLERTRKWKIACIWQNCLSDKCPSVSAVWEEYRRALLQRTNPLKPELNPICYLLALLGAHHFLHVSRIRVKSLTLRWLMSYIYGAPILDVSRSHTTTQHSR